jgi:predicted nucleotidyltransferase
LDPARAIEVRRQDILRILSQHGATSTKVFGSVARGESGPKSDLDLLVQLEPGYSLLDLIAIKQELEDLLGCKVDIVTEAALSPYMRDQIMQEATEV